MRQTHGADLSRQLRILAIGPRVGETATGVSIAFENLIEALDRESIEHQVVDLTQDSTVAFAGRFSHARAIFLTRKILLGWWRILQCDRVYLIIATSLLGFVRDFLLLWFAFLLRKETVVHLHGGGMEAFCESQTRLIKCLIQKTYNRVDKIIVLGKALRGQFGFVSDLTKIVVVENGLPSESQPLAQIIEQTPPADGVFRFLYLSNLMESKGYFRLLEAGKKLMDEQAARHFEIHFCGSFVRSVSEGTTAGFDEKKEAFLGTVGDDSLPKVFHYHGRVGGDRKLEILKQSHALVLPTFYPGEGQPLCIIEASAHGLPVISTKHAGIPEQVIDKETGFLLLDDSQEALVESMLQLLNLGDKQYLELSRNSVRHYEKHFTAYVHIKKMLDLLTSVSLRAI